MTYLTTRDYSRADGKGSRLRLRAEVSRRVLEDAPTEFIEGKEHNPVVDMDAVQLERLVQCLDSLKYFDSDHMGMSEKLRDFLYGHVRTLAKIVNAKTLDFLKRNARGPDDVLNLLHVADDGNYA